MKQSAGAFLMTLVIAGCSSGSGNKNDRSIVDPSTAVENGIVVSAHPQSSAIGVKILKMGGNAIDAAVATEFALSVCFPEAGNLGGGGFMLIRTNDGKTDVIDYREKAPKRASRDMFLDGHGNVTPGLSTETQLASGVPGTVDGLIRAHAKYGKLPFREVIQPAIDLAENGFQVTRMQASDLNLNRSAFLERNINRPAFVKESLWKEGDTLFQPQLAKTLSRIRESGREGFYGGITARLILKEIQRGNGIISAQDLNEYKSVSRTALTTGYKGYKIITVPPPSGGGIILIQLLKMTEQFPITKWGFHSVREIHLVAEAERRAFADRSEYPGDPEYMRTSVDKLISSKYLTARMATFNPRRASASAELHPGLPDRKSSEETTHYSVTDADGNAVSVTTTLNGTFGSSIVVDSAGFILNNQMDDFSLKPGFPNMYGLIGGEVNSISPEKRMLSSMTPVIVENKGKLFLVAGSPGGSTIPTTVFQVLINVIDFQMNIQDAVDAGRFHHQWLPDLITYEKSAMTGSDSLALSIMGHTLKERESIGSVNAILILPDGRKAGGSDKRGDNSSCGY